MKKLLSLLFGLLFVVSLSATNVAAGNVSGTWTTANSPFMVQGNITVPVNQTLTIQPGVYVYFPQNAGLTVNGRLLAQGSNGTGRIRFTCLNHALGWGGLEFTSTATSSDSSFISYALIEYSSSSGVLINNFNKLRISNSKINYCWGTGGGGISCTSSLLKIQYSSFSGNQSNAGGGISAISSTFKMVSDTISVNTATSCGGGVYAYFTSLYCLKSTFSGNYCWGNGQYGGGLYTSSGDINVISSSITNCSAGFGAGACIGSGGTILNSIFANNTALVSGGGIHFDFCSPTLVNCSIVNNIQTSQYSSSYRNGGGGVFCNEASPFFANCLLYGNTTGCYGSQVCRYNYTDSPAYPSFDYCDVQGGIEAFGNYNYIINYPYPSNYFTNSITTDPHFVNASTGNFQLQSTSPCVNTGTPVTIPYGLPSTDLLGHPRVYGNRIDMGCYEYCVLQPLATVTSGSTLAWGTRVLGQAAVTKQIVIANQGAANLRITQIALADTTRGFNWQYSGLNTNIAVGATATITVTFNPPRVGTYSNTLRITNNSSNQTTISVPLSGACTAVTLSTPQNVQVSLNNGNANITWSAVTTYNNGTSVTPAGYIVLYSEIPNAPTSGYYFLAFTTGLSYSHVNVVRYRNSMYYKVVATTNTTRMNYSELAARHITWGEIRNLCQ